MVSLPMRGLSNEEIMEAFHKSDTELKELFDGWAPLTTEQKKTVLQMEKAFSQNSK